MSGRTKLLLAVVGAGVVLVVLSTIRGGDSELRYAAPETERAEVDAGSPGPSLGDMTVSSGPLLEDGEEAGRVDGSCVVTSRPDDQEERRWRCGVTLTIGTEDGEEELQLAAVGRAEADDVIFSIVGGGGRYREARGDATFDYTDPDRAEITVRLKD